MIIVSLSTTVINQRFPGEIQRAVELSVGEAWFITRKTRDSVLATVNHPHHHNEKCTKNPENFCEGTPDMVDDLY